MTKLKYISLFSGIGGFELGIERALGKDNVECIGFSEVDKFALQVYQHHFPDHPSLGDVTAITEDDIKKILKKHKGCDLLVGGFPCTNLTSLANMFGNSDGLDGPASGLFWNMVQIIKWVNKYNKKEIDIVIENNASMKKENQLIITNILQSIYDNHPIYMTLLNAGDFGVQNRRRLYWTTFPITKTYTCTQTWDDILLPLDMSNKYIISDKMLKNTNKKFVDDNSLFYLEIIKNSDNTCTFKKINGNFKSLIQYARHSDTGINITEYKYPEGKSRTILRSNRIENVLIDRRCDNNNFIIRYLSPTEAERLFWFPDGWVTNLCSTTRSRKLLGNTVVVKVIEFIFTNY